MGAKKNLNHDLAVFAWGAMFVWWGIALMVDPITLGMTAAGTGLIMLATNAARVLKGIETVSSTTSLGFTLLAWGILDQIRLALGLPSGVSYALALVVIGLNFWVSAFTARPAAESN